MTDHLRTKELSDASALADDVLGVPRDVLARTWEQEPAALDAWTLTQAREALRVLTAGEQYADALSDRLERACDRIREALDVSSDQ